MIRRDWKISKITVIGIVILFVGIFFSTNKYAYAEENIQNVLILNSYHQGFSWSEEQTEGIMDKMQERPHNFSFLIEYMDWKNYNSVENINYLIEYYNYKCNYSEPPNQK